MFTEDSYRKLSKQGLQRLEYQWSNDARHKRTLEKAARDTLRLDEAEGFQKAASFVEAEVNTIRKVLDELQ